MASPQIAEEEVEESTEEEGDDPAEESAEAEQSDPPEPEGEPNVETVDLTDDDLDGDSAGDDLFTGSDDAQGSGDDPDGSEQDGDDADDADAEESENADDDVLDALDARGESMESAINEGVARLAVVGLDDDEKGDLEDEFTEVFEAFRLGYFGSRFAEEYVFAADDEEVDPTWGLVGAMLVCTAFTVWMRPDGDELVGQAREAVENIAGGSL